MRPQPTPSTTPTETKKAEPAEAETKSDAKPAETDKSLINEKGEGQEGAPEKYEDFKVPEGFVLDPEVAKDASALFKKHDLNQTAAQELVDFYVAKTRESAEQPYNLYREKRQEWRDKINSDPEIGGSKLNGTRVSIGKLIDSFGDPKLAEAFREAMDYTGAGDNPAVVKGLYALAKRLTEGGPVRGGGPSVDGQRAPGEGARSAAQAIYPNLPTRG